jgi:hypothetical protein
MFSTILALAISTLSFPRAVVLCHNDAGVLSTYLRIKEHSMGFFQAVLTGFAFALGGTLVRPVLTWLKRLVFGSSGSHRPYLAKQTEITRAL